MHAGIHRPWRQTAAHGWNAHQHAGARTKTNGMDASQRQRGAPDIRGTASYRVVAVPGGAWERGRKK